MIRSTLFTIFFFLVACGGGGGGSSSSPTTQPPLVTQPDDPVEEAEITFTRDLNAGLRRAFGTESDSDLAFSSGGVAASDFDGDGDIDLLFVGGDTEPNHLYENQGDGTFVEIATDVGLDIVNWASGPAFGDIDGDGDLDLFIGAINDLVFLFENRLNEVEASFVDITADSGIVVNSAVSSTFFDYDGDGYLDLFVTHWGTKRQPGEDTETVWRNNGDYTFENRSIETGVAAGLLEVDTDWSFTASFSDIDGDGDGDLLIASDYETSQVLRNNGDGTFSKITDRDVIVDQSGMGSAIGDFDNDGNMDWFVTSIYNLDIGEDLFGNRLYRNDGEGLFTDVTEESATSDGSWGWGVCAADFDNDTHVDLAHVNGWRERPNIDYVTDQARLFRNMGESGILFEERSTESGFNDRGQGRGIVCFDAERDGDIDIVISNNENDSVVFYRNETDTSNHYLAIRLVATGMNSFGVGAHITLTTSDGSQVRELGGTNNFVSHNPFEVHFGLGAATRANVTVRWLDGETTTLMAVDADQLLTINQE